MTQDTPARPAELSPEKRAQIARRIEFVKTRMDTTAYNGGSLDAAWLRELSLQLNYALQDLK